jgi:uncharacterized protein
MPEDTDSNARTWAALCHLGAFAAFLGIPFGHLIGPLLVWTLKRGDSAFVDDQGREAVNFQISLTIYMVALAVLGGLALLLVVGPAVWPLFDAGPWLFAATAFVVVVVAFGLLVYAFVATIVAAVRANEGVRFRYPLTIRLLR